MSQNKSDKHNKSKHKPFKKPSVVTKQIQSPDIDQAVSLPLSTIPDDDIDNIPDINSDLSDIEIDQTFISYAKRTNPAYHKSAELQILEDQEPFNRRQSFLQDMQHKPYWQDEHDKGVHPFQTPKSTNSPFFINDPNATIDPNIVNKNNNNHKKHKKNSNKHKHKQKPQLVGIPSNGPVMDQYAHHSPSNTNSNSSHSPVILNNQDVNPQQIVNNNHSGRITQFVRNGQMNPISLYKIEYTKADVDAVTSNKPFIDDYTNHFVDDPNDEDDSYSSGDQDIVIVDGTDDNMYNNSNNTQLQPRLKQIAQQQTISVKNNKHQSGRDIVKNSFLGSATARSPSAKKVSFGGVSSTLNYDNKMNDNNITPPSQPQPQTQTQPQPQPRPQSQSLSLSPTMTPHLLIQSASGTSPNSNIIATATPNTDDKKSFSYNNLATSPFNNATTHKHLIGAPLTSKTAPSSPAQKKFKFNPQVSNIQNQRHSVVSIAMIQRVRDNGNHLNGLISTPSLSHSMNSVDEEDIIDMDLDNINASFYRNGSKTPSMIRSSTEDHIIHNKKKKKKGKYKVRSHKGISSNHSSPKQNAKNKNKNKKKGFGWQKKKHSYRPHKERYVNSDGLYTISSSKSNSPANSPAFKPLAYVDPQASPQFRRTQSDVSKTNKNPKNLNLNKVPPGTNIINSTKISNYPIPIERIYNKGDIKTNNPSPASNASDIPSLFTSISKQIVTKKHRERLNQRDIENLIPITVSKYISYIAEQTGSPKLIPPQRWDFTTVAMFADVSGFTKLSEHLAQAGAGGAEKLAFYLNRYLEQLANKARKEGGDIFKFAGDAIIIVWPPDFEEDKLPQHQQSKLREERIARATQAARSIQNEFHNMEIIKGSITLSVKIGIGYGASSLLFVGGQFGRIEYLLCGSALKQAFDCESFAKPGDVIISKQAYKWVKDKFVYGLRVYDDGTGHGTTNPPKNMDDLYGPDSPKKARSVLSRALSNKMSNHSNHASLDLSHSNSNSSNHSKTSQTPMSNGYNKNYNLNYSKVVAWKVQLDKKKYKKVHSKALRADRSYLVSEHLQAFVPRAAWQRLLLRFKPWHGEQRAVTVLFINLDFNAYDNDNKDNMSDDDMGTPKPSSNRKKRSNLENMPQDLLQAAVKTTQKCIYRYKGSLNKFLFDDKGSTVIAVFGLPPIANFDDCTRAVLAALLIEQKMKTLKIKARIGVTTGRIYIGVVGAAGSASEYGILGDQVNLAARLMQHAIKPIPKGGLGGEGVVVSNTTYAQAKECINIEWQRLQSTLVKGFSKEFTIWRPHWRKITRDLSMKRNRFFIGWKDTMNELKTRLLDLTRSDDKSRGYVVAIEADHWGGATYFARQLLHEIHQQIYVVGTTNLAFNDDKLYAWRSILTRIIRELRLLRNTDDIGGADLKFHSAFSRFLLDTGGKQLIKYLPVLNEILNTHFISDNAVINSIIPEPLTDYEKVFGHHKLKSYAPNLPPAMSPVVPPNVNDDDNTYKDDTPDISQIDNLTQDEKDKLLLKYRVDIIIHLLKQVSKYSTMVILISKFHYMSLVDWSITECIASRIYSESITDISLILVGWSMDTTSLTYLISSEEKEIRLRYHKLRKLCWLHFILPKWTKQEVRDFLKFEFDIEKPSKSVLHFIVNKTDGIPGMVKCLVHDPDLLFLKHGGHLDCSQIERCRDLQTGSRYSDINLKIPYAIQSYYTKMLDSLDQFTLLTVKTASVISVGQEFLSVSFSYDMLYHCHPLKNDVNTKNNYAGELHSALSMLESDRFVYKFKQDKLTQEMLRLSDFQKYQSKHDRETFYVFSSGFLRDVTYGNMLYKQRSSIHKRVKELLDRDPYNCDPLVQQCIRRHHLLSLHDGFYINKDDAEAKRQAILSGFKPSNSSNKNNKKIKYKNFDKHQSVWSFPQCVLVLYIQNVTGLPDHIKYSSYVTIHVGDDKGKSLTQSSSCDRQYISLVLNENILKQIEGDENIGPVLTMRLWYKQAYRVDKSIGKFTLVLRHLYEKQLAEQMLLINNNNKSISDPSHPSNTGSKRNSLNNNHLPNLNNMLNKSNNHNIHIDDHSDLFVGYKMPVTVKNKKKNKFNLAKNLYIEAFVRFCIVDDNHKMQQNHNMTVYSPNIL